MHNIIQFNIEAFKMNRLSVDALYRISTTEVERYELIRCAKPGRSGAIDQVKELLGDVFVECKELTLWCEDNARREFLVLCDENGLDNRLLPNHRANALVSAGRFTDHNFNDIGTRSNRTKNQDLKDSQGCNFFVGDVFILVEKDTVAPDMSIYGDNPLEWILEFKEPSERMINAYGKNIAIHKIAPQGVLQLVSMSPQLTFACEWVGYKLIPEGMGEIDPAYAALIFKWYNSGRDPNDTDDLVEFMDVMGVVLTMHPGLFQDQDTSGQRDEHILDPEA